MLIEIARGTTAVIPATTGESQDGGYYCPDSWGGGFLGGPYFEHNSPNSQCEEPAQYFGRQKGWHVSIAGDDSLSVTVSADVGTGQASAFVVTGRLWGYIDGFVTEEPPSQQLLDEHSQVEYTAAISIGSFFKVVCMTTKITVTETYRDENIYRLSCTATPQGGTAPYTYDWSSDIDGSQALGALDQATLEVEIPTIGAGFISVDVSDSGDPACTALASFDVCGNVNCNFTTALISTLPTGATGPYIYECVSSSLSGLGDLIHQWSPSPIEISADGRVAKFSFPDDDEHSIDLTVRDFAGCHGFKTHKVGGYEFTISTDPGGEDTGAISGTRDTMQFTVTVTAQATGNFTATPPSQLTLEFSRLATSETGTAVGTLVSSSPPRYQYLWPVRQAKGRWQIKVQGYKSNTATFKIDKREQIVKVAQSWPGAAQRGFDETPPQPSSYQGGDLCDALARYIYGYVGLTIAGGGNDVEGLYASVNTTTQDAQKGLIAFYHFPTDPNTEWRHNAINIGGGQIVDQNCGLAHQTDPPIPLIGSHSDTDPDLVKPSKYAAPSYHSTTELQSIDAE